MAKVEITNKLLKEAIADAEAVRQTAIENAKLSLEETFTPQIQAMLERKLRAEAESVEGTEEASELPFEEGEPEGSSEMPADSSDIGAGDNMEPSDDAFASADDDMSGEAPADSETDWYEDWSEKDFDLDEVIKELEEDVKLLEEEGSEEEESTEDEESSEEDKEESDDEEGEEDKEESSEEESSEDDKEESSDEEGHKVPVNPFLKHKKEMDEEGYPEGELAGHGKGKLVPSKIGIPGQATFTLDEFVAMMKEAGYNLPEMGFDHVVPSNEPPMEETDLNLEEILTMLEAEDEARSSSEQMASEVQALQEELAEYRKAVDILRGKLHEVNLLNAKLLYTNKIFRKEGLSNEQKVSIVENFDRATTVREVKMVYAVLAESLVPRKSATKAARASKKIVAEGLASKPTPSTAPKTEAPEIIAENSVAKRLQQLAGIIS